MCGDVRVVFPFAYTCCCVTVVAMLQGGKLSPGELAGNPIVLLADTEHEVAGAYGVWKQESMFGKSHPGVERTTFIIDENRGASPVIFGETGDSALVGVVLLEALGFALDPIRRVLRPLPMILGRATGV